MFFPPRTHSNLTLHMSVNETVCMNLPVVAVKGERSLWCGRCAGLEIVHAAFVDYNVAQRPCGIGKRKYSRIFLLVTQIYSRICIYRVSCKLFERAWNFFFLFLMYILNEQHDSTHISSG